MLAWYRAQLNEHGARAATGLLWRVLWARGVADFSNRFLARRVACPCCGWEGRRFLDYVEVGYTVPNASCPRCDSHPRHRWLYLWLRDRYRLAERSGVALVFAPERALAPLWRSAKGLKVCSVDIERARGVDVLADIQRLPFRADTADLIWCHHVLSEVEDDRKALGELRRVLRPETGELVVSVFIAPGQASTHEFGAADKTMSRTWRRYGEDFETRLAGCGLRVSALDAGLSPDDYRHYGLDPVDRFYVCTKDSAQD